MHSMSLNKLSDFMLVLNSLRKHPTKNKYFYEHILFSTIYLLQEQRLNPRNYLEQEINMIMFLHAAEYDVHMHAKFIGSYFL
jgi:hypothetical protein